MTTAMYATDAMLRAALGMDPADGDDDLVARALRGACRRIDAATGRVFGRDEGPSARVYRPAGRLLWDGGGHLLLVDDIATAEGLTVEIGWSGGTWTTVTGIDAIPDNASARGEAITGLVHPREWPLWHPQSRVRVTAVWGWPAVPAEVETASLLLAARLYRRKDSPEGVLGSSEWGTVRLSRTDPDVAELITHLVLPGMA